MASTTLSVEIYSMARQGVSLTINALSTILFLFTFLLVIGYYFISKNECKWSNASDWGLENEKVSSSVYNRYFHCFFLPHFCCAID